MCIGDRGDDDDDEWEDTDDEGDFDSEGGLSAEEDGEDDGRVRQFLFMDEETKSRFTEYSMTSSVMRRNEQLTLLDDRFEKVTNAQPGGVPVLYLTHTQTCVVVFVVVFRAV